MGQRCAVAVASMAVGVIGVGCLAIGWRRITTTQFAVLMLVVPQMRCLGRMFVLAIGCRCRPEGLQRQPTQQENGDPATHDEKCSKVQMALVVIHTPDLMDCTVLFIQWRTTC